MRQYLIENPYRPGAGHAPPFLAGRRGELDEFKRLIRQPVITENVLVTGLRGYGKTVLLDQLRQVAQASDWLWVGNDLSEASSLTEERMAVRILTDLSQAITARFEIGEADVHQHHDFMARRMGTTTNEERSAFTFEALRRSYDQAPGLPSDRLRTVLTRVLSLIHRVKLKGLILAYDEAQCLSDSAARNEFPMSMLVEAISSLQKGQSSAPCLLIFSGLPHVLDYLTEARAYTERMFTVMTLDRLGREETRQALTVPIANLPARLHTPPDLIDKVVGLTGGYPYLIQFFGRELVDQLLENGGTLSADRFPSPNTLQRLDAGLFSARWNRTTDKQRELLGLIASRPVNPGGDFSARELDQLRGFVGEAGQSPTTQMLTGLCERGVLYRTRHGRYAFTVPMSEFMILKRLQREDDIARSWDAEPEIPVVPPPVAAAPLSEHKAERAPRRRRGWFA